MKDQYVINMQFAEELLQFLYTKVPLIFGFRTTWNPEFILLDSPLNKTNESFDSIFEEEIGWTMYYIIKQNVKDIVDSFQDLLLVSQLMESDDTAANFSKAALQIAPSYFIEGYSHESFLAYCAMVIGVACNFFLLSQNNVPQRACQVIALVLFSHQMTGQFHELEGWIGLYKTAYNLNSAVTASLEKQNEK